MSETDEIKEWQTHSALRAFLYAISSQWEWTKGWIFMEANSIVFSVWFLIGAALVFWMQAGFAMVEAGFTRIKNTGNIIMKNLMDFCIGTVVLIIIEFAV